MSKGKRKNIIQEFIHYNVPIIKIDDSLAKVKHDFFKTNY